MGCKLVLHGIARVIAISTYSYVAIAIRHIGGIVYTRLSYNYIAIAITIVARCENDARHHHHPHDISNYRRPPEVAIAI